MIASIAITTPLLADNLSDALQNLKVKGEIKAEYSDSNFLGAAKSEDITAVGGSLGVITGDFYGFSAGVTFQASTVLTDDFNAPTAGPQIDPLDASGARLSESYIQYKYSNTSLKAGRQYIYTPLVSTAIDGKSSETVLKDSFEAYVLTNTDIPNTTLVAGYVNKYQNKVDATSNDIGDFKDFQDGAYTIYAKNTSIENLTLQAQYLDESGKTSATDKDALYLQADYNLNGHMLSAQFLSSTDKTQAANAQDGKLFGLKATGPLGIGKLGYVLAYNSSTDKNAPVYVGAGSGTTDTPFTAMPVHGGGVPTRADTDTIVGAIAVPVMGATAVGYAGKSMSSTHPIGDVTAMGAIAIYPVSKNLLLKVNYEHVEVEKIPKDTDTTRVYLTYKF